MEPIFFLSLSSIEDSQFHSFVPVIQESRRMGGGPNIATMMTGFIFIHLRMILTRVTIELTIDIESDAGLGLNGWFHPSLWQLRRK